MEVLQFYIVTVKMGKCFEIAGFKKLHNVPVRAIRRNTFSLWCEMKHNQDETKQSSLHVDYCRLY